MFDVCLPLCNSCHCMVYRVATDISGIQVQGSLVGHIFNLSVERYKYVFHNHFVMYD